jgi:integrase/recombinase XerC
MTNIYGAWRAVIGAVLPPDIRPHRLRHSYVTRSLRRGVQVTTLAQITGHKNLATLSRYAHESDADKLEAAERAAQRPRNVVRFRKRRTAKLGSRDN